MLKIVLIMDNRAAYVQASPFVFTVPRSDGLYSLEGFLLELDAVDPVNVLILPDNMNIAQGDKITDAIRAKALPFEQFHRETKEQAAADALGLVMRASVAQGLITDEEVLRVAPALMEREWRPGLTVAVGDLYTHKDYLWRCVTAHTTQGDWRPDKVPALWRKVEAIEPDKPRVWQAQTDYNVGDAVHYPNANAQHYVCLQWHTSQVGWEPPKVPALWRLQKE
jgi:hypothetical protein